MFDGRNHRDIIKMRFGRDASVCAEISAVPCHAVLSCTHVEVYLSLIISQCWYWLSLWQSGVKNFVHSVKLSFGLSLKGECSFWRQGKVN